MNKKLFWVKLSGSYTHRASIVRADNAGDAERRAKVNFDRTGWDAVGEVQVLELQAGGPSEVLAEVGFFETN